MTETAQQIDHHSRLDWWRRQIQRQQNANLAVAQFCRQLGVSATTFYYWKRRVQEVSGAPFGRVSAKHSSRHSTRSADASTANFLPVSIIEPSAGTQLEIELANACVVRLKGAIDPTLLRAAITAAGQLDGSREGAH
jgi:transposase-like protein